MRRAVMNNENKSSYLREPDARITRARAKALGPCGGLPPLYPLAAIIKDDKVSRTNAKRAAASKPRLDACPKKRAVFKDVTNVITNNADANFVNAGRSQHSKQDKDGSLQKTSHFPWDERENVMHSMNKVKVNGLQEAGFATSLKIEPTEFVNKKMSGAACLIPTNANSKNRMLCKKDESLDDSGVIDIDSKHDDTQMCSLYAADICYNLYTAELARRASVDYMEEVQRDITHDMRAILIDWLVEVSDEYKMVPDTLYLTVNLIDRFLSENYIEKQKLQLLGVTCMLIAAKYEEISAPHVEEFCFITANTYTKEEVMKMESRVLNFLGFRLSVPTTKKFLRRFIQAAQVSYEVPSVELEFLANYLAELTLIEYSFLKFLPSLIAASAVFLARWTLDQSNHPWNPTLEHYTRYKTSELKKTVLELHELQLNSRGCEHKAVREKYKQSKFKCVSILPLSKAVQSLFEGQHVLLHL